jgi:hypothetical protein
VTLVPSFVDLLQPLTCVMSAPTFQSFMTLMCRKDKSRVVQCLGRVYAAPARLLKIVAVEPLCGGRIAQAFFSTCPNDSIQEVLVRYAARWSIELFFRFFKQILGMRHLLSQRARGVEIQVYCAVIACLIIQLQTGRKPDKRTVEVMGYFFMGLASEQEVIDHLNKPDRTGVKLRAKEALWKKLGY